MILLFTLTLIKLLLDRSRKIKHFRLLNNCVGIFFNLFRSNNKVSKDNKFSKALSLMLFILLSDSFKIWRFFSENVPFWIICILFFDKSSICRESNPKKLSDGTYTTRLFEISMVSRNVLLANSFSGSVYK